MTTTNQQVTMQDLENTLSAIDSAKPTASAPTGQYSNQAPMRGAYRDGGRPQVSHEMLETIDRNNKARDQYCLTPLTDMTGKDFLIVSTCQTGHKLPQYSNLLRVVSLSKTGKANILSSGIFGTSTPYEEHAQDLTSRISSRGYNPEIIDITSMLRDPQTKVLTAREIKENRYSGLYNLFVTKTDKKDNFLFITWAFDGEKFAPACMTKIVKPDYNGPMFERDFKDCMTLVKRDFIAKSGAQDAQVSIRYMGAFEQPINQ